MHAGHPEGNLFHGHEIPVHIQASWGGFELVDIAKELYKAALTDKVRSIHLLHIPHSYGDCIGRVHIFPLLFGLPSC